MTVWVRIVVVSNRVVSMGIAAVVVLMVLGFAWSALAPKWDPGVAYGAFVIGVPLTWVSGMVTGAAAVMLHLSGRWDGFWESAAPPVLGVVCLYFMMASQPPPPAFGAVIAAILGVVCLVAALRRGAPVRQWGIVPLLALPFLGLIEPLAFWAQLAAALVFFGTWAWTRFEPIRDRLRSA
jgi:hypothetical protein